MAQKEDFLGFTFGGVHSSNLNIVRTSDGDRFDEQIIPEVKDIAVEVPGMDGQYFFGSTYGSRTFEVSFAFDHLTEFDFRRLRQVYGRKYIDNLIFDERPYKKYLAKIESPIELSYICFNEPNYTWQKIPLGISEETGQMEYVQGISGDYEYKAYDDTTRRIYKGEGKISFVCHFPFAKSVYKQLPIAEEESDWAVSSGILNSTLYENIDIYNDGEIQVYNPGDIETGFRMYIPQALLTTETILTYMSNFNQDIASLSLNSTEMKNGDVGILIDTNNSLIIGVSSAPVGPDPMTGEYTYTTSGNLYNEIINSGYFFKIKTTPFNTIDTIQIEGGGEGIQIFYDYLYF